MKKLQRDDQISRETLFFQTWDWNSVHYTWKKTGQNERNSISLKPQRNGKSYFISQHTCKATAHPVGSRATGASPQQAKTQRVQSICIPPSLAPYEQQAPPRQD